MKAIRGALLIGVFIGTYAAAFQNEPKGFRGIEWGQDISTVADQFSQVGSTGGDDINYVRKDDRLTIGNAELQTLWYRFYKGRLSSVIAASQGITNRRALLDAFESQFGRGDKPNQYIERYFWRGAITGIFLDCGVSDHCNLLILSQEIGRLKREEQKRSGAEKARGDF